MRFPVRVLSDLHLGHPASLITDVAQLRPLIIGAGTLVFNGDTWQELAKAVEQASAQMLEGLMSLCEEEGVDVVFLPGNHDPSISDQNYMEIDHGRILVMHGHTVFPQVSPWSNYYFDNQEQVDALLAQRLPLVRSVDDRFDLAREVVQRMTPRRWKPRKSRLHYYTNTLWPPKRFRALLSVKKQSIPASLEFVQEFFPKAEVVIIGHFHRAYVHSSDGGTLVNTGAFMSGCQSIMVEIDQDKICLKKVALSKCRDSFLPIEVLEM